MIFQIDNWRIYKDIKLQNQAPFGRETKGARLIIMKKRFWIFKE